MRGATDYEERKQRPKRRSISVTLQIRKNAKVGDEERGKWGKKKHSKEKTRGCLGRVPSDLAGGKKTGKAITVRSGATDGRKKASGILQVLDWKTTDSEYENRHNPN